MASSVTMHVGQFVAAVLFVTACLEVKDNKNDTMTVFGLALMTLLLLLPESSYTQKHYAGEIPDGYDVRHFLSICLACGEFYGGSVERSCIFDKTFETFNNCMIAIFGRRRK